MAEVHSARLGFRCARLPGTLSSRDAVSLLECALDNGITHFDTARIYGGGEADTLLGALAARRRREMVIFGKAGITPASFRARVMEPGGAAAPQFKQFSRAQMLASVDASLRSLRTEYLDALLLHEISANDVTDDLRDVLEELRRSGKILRWGVASSVKDCVQLLTDHSDLCGIVQAPAAWLDAPRDVPSDTLVIVRSVLQSALQRVQTRIGADAVVSEKLRTVGVDANNLESMAQLLLQAAAQRNPNGVMLFSATRKEHVILNAAALRRAAETAQLDALRELATLNA